MIECLLVGVIAALLVYIQFQQVKLTTAEHDYDSLSLYNDGLRDEIARLKSTIRFKQDSLEEVYDELESCIRCPESVGCGGKC